jgi:hypothetical protein
LHETREGTKGHNVAPFLAIVREPYLNVDARGLERLAELTDALMSVPDREKAIRELFSVMERPPDADLGSPGPLVHTLESAKPTFLKSK